MEPKLDFQFENLKESNSSNCFKCLRKNRKKIIKFIINIVYKKEIKIKEKYLQLIYIN